MCEAVPGTDGPSCQDDNFAFIEHLLDTLQDEGASAYESEGDDIPEISSPGCGNPASPGARTIDVDLNCALDGASAVVASEVGAESERRKWNGLLTRFCEDGDENVLDTLLDCFLTSKSDAAMLVEALGDATPSQRQGYSRDAHLHLSLDQLDHLTIADLESPSQKVWDALLDSARGLLQRSRSPRHSPTSHKALGVDLEESLITRGMASDRNPSSNDGLSEGSDSRMPSDVADALPAELRSPTSRAAFLSKIAEMEEANHDVARAFMKRFFLGVRSRLLSCVEDGPDDGSDEYQTEASEEQSSVCPSAESNAVTELSVWSCRS